MYYKYKPKECQACQLDIEYEDHVMRCNCNTREQLHKEWALEVQKYLNRKHTPVTVRESNLAD
jgi:hypothetical protein